jgi:hypothetical protein
MEKTPKERLGNYTEVWFEAPSPNDSTQKALVIFYRNFKLWHLILPCFCAFFFLACMVAVPIFITLFFRRFDFIGWIVFTIQFLIFLLIGFLKIR